jgi:hypothetical protein
MSKVLAVINFIDRYGRPVDPGYGISADRPDNSLPGFEGPVDPDYGIGIGHPSHGLPRPPAVWPPQFPPTPVDPDWGVNAPARPSLPIYIPVGPDNTLPGLPPVAGHLPTIPLVPGSVWPPLPPGLPPGKVAILVFISGLGHRYAIIEVPPPEVSGPPKPQPK